MFLHGYGADGNDLIEIGRAWQGLLPRRRLRVAARAAAVRPGADGPRVVSTDLPRSGRALARRQHGRADARSRSSTPSWRGATCRASALALVGFSQGTMMALHVGLRRAVAPAAIVGYSGMLVLPENATRKQSRRDHARPPVLLLHGDADELIPVEALFLAAQGLAALGVPVEWHISAGIGHGIDQEGLRHGGEFLARRFCATPQALLGAPRPTASQSRHAAL